MRFSTITVLGAAATTAQAASIQFVNQDETTRTVYFTPNSGLPEIAPTTVPGNQEVTVNFPSGWTGNCYSVSEGQPNVPGMLAEVSFNSWNGLTFFDVSAIVNPNDNDGVRQLYPADEAHNFSGCTSYDIPMECLTAYNLPDDTQTKATSNEDLICTLGTPSGDIAARDVVDERSPSVARGWVEGKWNLRRN